MITTSLKGCREVYSAANDPRPQMIPKLDRKWSRTANDLRWGPQMIPLENEEWNGVWFSWIFFTFYSIHVYFFSQLNYYVDKHKEKNILTTLTMIWNIIFVTNSSNFLSTILLKKSKLVDSNTISQRARSTVIIV